MCVFEGKHLSYFIKDLTHNSTKDLKNVARVFPFIVGVKHLTLHVIWAWIGLEILQKMFDPRFRLIESNFRSIKPCGNRILISCNYSIPKLH